MAAVSDARPSSPAASPLPRFLLLYAALYSAYGAESAYLPSFLQSHGLGAESIGAVLSTGTVVRIASGPAAGRLADRLGARRGVLAAAALLSGLIGTLYLGAYGLLPLLLVCMAHSSTEASLAPLSDALAVAASMVRGGFRYGWVRGAGSAAFVAGTLLSGQLVDRFGLWCIIAASSALFLAMALAATRVAAPDAAGEADRGGTLAAARTLLAVPAYRTLLLVAALIVGSHAVNDAFAVITWRGAGYGGTAVSLLWSESVLAEVFVFFVLGPRIIDRVGPAGAAAVAAGAGMVRWGVMGFTLAWPALAAVQALHGLTFALFHLGAMRVIGTAVPERLGATAQAVYGNVALGLASAALTFASGYLYAGLGLHVFWAMAGLCGVALALAPGLRRA
ncbi:MFS transporter [Lichenibacterium dinghuense]|uniref:MFS transporter n=1 Tax=Lichenibacterium dinghuense TaxID=2895977 RepID=UPI001F3C9269|nr:MFS transporter [Lichenibacterium sp. 6Y81]